jgi:hypothetical protein
MASSAGSAGLGALASLVLVVVGVIVERWCLIRPDDQDRDGAAGTRRAPGMPA